MKGLPDLYDKTCHDLGGEPFVEWIQGAPAQYVQGQFCTAVVWYVKRKRWYLEEANYDPHQEDMSTWRAKELAGNLPPTPEQNVMKYFDLEKDERLISTNGKTRPVILLQRSLCDWWNPTNAARHIAYWLAVPLFRYKDRHSQDYVLMHERLQDGCVFYVPPFYGKNPRVDEESAARFHAIQAVPENQLAPLKRMCSVLDPPMSRPFKLSALGLRLVSYHFYRSIGCLTELKATQTEYDLFKDQVNVLLDSAKVS